MSATLFGCGCLVNRDAEGLLVSITPCDGHRWMLQPELEAFYQRLCDLRALEAHAPEPPAAAPDIEIVYVDETPLDALRSVPSGCERQGPGSTCLWVRVRDDVDRCSVCGREMPA